MVFQALIASVFSGAEILIIKSGFARMKLHSEHFATLYFLANAVLMIPFAFLFFNPVAQMVEPKYLLLLLGLIVCAVVYNLCNFKGYKYTTIERAQPIMMSSWVFSIFFAFIIYPSERNVKHIVLAFIALIALYLSFMRSFKFSIHKGTFFLLVGAVFVGLHSIFVKELVEIYNPFALYFIRAVLIVLILYPILRPPKSVYQPRTIWYFVGFSSLVIVENIFLYWSYDLNGIVLTSLFMTLAPLVGLWGSVLFFKEKLHMRNVLITLVIVGCIVLSLI